MALVPEPSQDGMILSVAMDERISRIVVNTVDGPWAFTVDQAQQLAKGLADLCGQVETLERQMAKDIQGGATHEEAWSKLRRQLAPTMPMILPEVGGSQ